MTKRERLEDLGKLSMMLEDIMEMDFFMHTNSKHAEEEWIKENYEKIEYEEPRGLSHIFHQVRWLRNQIEECYYLAKGDDE